MIERKPPKIEDKSFQIFTRKGKYNPWDILKLSAHQKKIYNMIAAGFGVEAVATRINQNVSSVRAQVSEIRAKGVEI